MSDLERFNELVDDIWEMVFGTVRRPEVKFKGMMKEAPKPKRARTKKGTYRADDLTTKDFNEAYVGGKAPKKKKRKK
jgi:hypothetical protein